MSILSGTVNLGRAFAESLLTETVEFYRVTGTSVDPNTLNEVETAVVVYTVPARVKYSSLIVSESRGAGEVVGAQSVSISVGVGSTPTVNSDFMCRVVDSSADTSLIGRKYRVKGFPQSGQVTAHRYPVEEVS